MRTVPQQRLALIGPTGAGKTTVALFMQMFEPKSAVLSIAQPLRDVEEFIYGVLQRPGPGITRSQDGELLQQIRELLLNRDPDLLKTCFAQSLQACRQKSLIINDDCRQAMEQSLRSQNFKFIWVDGPSRARSDPSRPRPSLNEHDLVIEQGNCDESIVNSGSLSDLMANVDTFLRRLMLPASCPPGA